MKGDAIKKMMEGHAHFRAEIFPELKSHFRSLAESQKPDVLFIACADSRVVPSLIFQTEPGELFICRVVGNVVPPYREVYGGTSATIEYAVKALNVKHIVICGHSDCGAVRAVFEDKDLLHLPMMYEWLHYIEAARPEMHATPEGADEMTQLKEFICANVRKQLENLMTHPEVEERMAEGKLQVHGWFYDIASGAVEVVDPATGNHRPIEENLEPTRG